MRVKPFPVAISHTKHYRNLFYKYIYIWPYNMFVQKAKNACIHTGVCVCVRRLKKQQRTLHEINTEVPEVILNYPGHSYRGVCTTSIVSTSHKPNALVMSPSVVKYRGGLCLYIYVVCVIIRYAALPQISYYVPSASSCIYMHIKWNTIKDTFE